MVSSAIKYFFGFKLKVFSFLMNDISKHKKENRINKNVVKTVTNNQSKDELPKNNCLRHS